MRYHRGSETQTGGGWHWVMESKTGVMLQMVVHVWEQRKASGVERTHSHRFRKEFGSVTTSSLDCLENSEREYFFCFEHSIYIICTCNPRKLM